DLIRLWREHRQEIAGDALGHLLAEPELRRAFTWSLEHTDRLFGTGILGALGLCYNGSEAELLQVYFPGRQARVSAGDFRRRLESKDRLRLFAAVPTACPSEETTP
ncbi:MAG TPA: hypothetical protein VGR07_16760, partial [Thermoanaerobaculia bacterium]|nr:hypothetical protein [Thermoanaerobaculia bacterium]